MPLRCVIAHKNNGTCKKIIQQVDECGIEILSVSDSYDDLIKSILKQKPTFVLADLDNKLVGTDVFTLRRELIELTDAIPEFIGLSTSQNMAYKALKNNFFDYLLLPLTSSELCIALHKITRRSNSIQNTKRKICLRTYSDYRFLDADCIQYIKADNNGADFYLNNGSKVASLKGLKYFENQLPTEFLRIHKSYIVNTNHISRIDFAKLRCTIANADTLTIPFSKSYRKDLEILKEKIFNESSVSVL